jgi:hypothetical protein
MAVRQHNFRSGVTLVELLVTVLAVMILVVGISGILAAGHRNYNTMFKRINSDVVRNAYEARLIFDGIVRRSSLEVGYVFPTEAYFYYFSIPLTGEGMVDIDAFRGITQPNRFARFHVVGRELRLDQGAIPVGTDLSSAAPPSLSPDSSRTIAFNVDSVEFTYLGSAVRMVLVLDNENPPSTPLSKLETLRMTVTTTAIRHNRDSVVAP